MVKWGLMVALVMVMALLSLSFVDARLFVDVDVAADSLVIHPGDNVNANVLLVAGSDVRIDYVLMARVYNEEEVIVYESQRVLALQNEVYTTLEIRLPDAIAAGKYRLEIDVGGVKADAYFIVEAPLVDKHPVALYGGVLGVFLLFIIAFILYNRKLNKSLEQYEPVELQSIIKGKRR